MLFERVLPLVLATSVAAACAPASSRSARSDLTQPQLSTVTLVISGMT